MPRQDSQPSDPRAARPEHPAIGGEGREDSGAIERSLGAIPDEQFGYREARHLLWRAGFGGTDDQVRRLVSWGPEKSVDTLLNFGAGAAGEPFEPPQADTFNKDIMRPPTEEERRMVREAQRSQNEDELARVRKIRQDAEQADRRQMNEVQKWWLRRMIETKSPMEEKLTLFWHGHFATSYRTIENSYHMYLQNQTLRRHAAGSFAEMLGAIIRDPAMIAYLDNNDSRKNKPNENLAREIMELFSLGVGNYSEEDIKEGAKALTGYTFVDDDFQFQQRNHDNSEKVILGNKGSWDGEDFVRIILGKKACARYITRRLYHFLVADVPPDERGGEKNLLPAQRAVLKDLGDLLYSRQYQLKPVLRKLLLSRHFYDHAFINQQIKSPVVLAVGAVRTLNTPVRDLSILNDGLDLMGQRIFFPPSVKGWDGGRSWINTSTFFVRQNLLSFLLTGKKPQGYDATADIQKFDAFALLDSAPADSGVARREPPAVARHLLRLTLGQEPDVAVETLVAYLAKENNVVDQRTVTGMLLIVTAMPEYQLC
ncbi:MAG: DUF1800 domain-containing protein [Phycisphaerales bacterium]